MKAVYILFGILLVSNLTYTQEDPLLHFNKGVESAAAKDYKRAIEAFDRALAIDPNLYYIYASRAESKTEIGDFKGALDDYNQYKKIVEDLNLLGDPEILDKRQKLLTLMPSNSSEPRPDDSPLSTGNDAALSNSDLKTLYYRGKLKFESGDVSGALRDFNYALSQDSTFVSALVGRAYVFLKQRDLLASLKDFNLAIQYNPNEYNALVGRGEVKDKLRNYQSATEDYNLAINLYPGKYIAFYDRGLSWFNQKKFDRAEEDFTAVIKLNSKHFKAYFSRAITKINMGRITDACLDLKAAQNLGHPQAAEYLLKFCK